MKSCRKEPPRLSLTEAERQSGCGFVHQLSIRDTYCLHSHTFYEFFLISRGKGIHRINGSSTLLSEGSFVLVRPSDTHCYDFLNQYDLELINIPFLPIHFERICRLFDCSPAFWEQPALCPQVELEGPQLAEMRSRLLTIGQMESGVPRRQYLLSVLPSFLYPFVAAQGPDSPEGSGNHQRTPFPAWLSQLLSRMELRENYVEGLPRMIALSHMSQEYLTRSFQKWLHMSPTEFINSRRMELAASLLLEEQLSILEVCQECGFRNLSYFYRMFREQYGCAPGKFGKKE